jgi:hypothetical protein
MVYGGMVDTTTELDEGLEQESEFEFDQLLGIIGDGVVGAIGGMVGVALLTGALFIATNYGAFDPEVFTSFGQMIGLDSSIAAGYVIFALQGMIPFPLLFASLKAYLPGERDPVKGIFFGTALWTGFVIAFFGDVSGASLWLYVGLTLVGHWAYGAGLGLVFEYLTTRPDTIV